MFIFVCFCLDNHLVCSRKLFASDGYVRWREFLVQIEDIFGLDGKTEHFVYRKLKINDAHPIFWG